MCTHPYASLGIQLNRVNRAPGFVQQIPQRRSAYTEVRSAALPCASCCHSAGLSHGPENQRLVGGLVGSVAISRACFLLRTTGSAKLTVSVRGLAHSRHQSRQCTADRRTRVPRCVFHTPGLQSNRVWKAQRVPSVLIVARVCLGHPYMAKKLENRDRPPSHLLD